MAAPMFKLEPDTFLFCGEAKLLKSGVECHFVDRVLSRFYLSL